MPAQSTCASAARFHDKVVQVHPTRIGYVHSSLDSTCRNAIWKVGRGVIPKSQAKQRTRSLEVFRQAGNTSTGEAKQFIIAGGAAARESRFHLGVQDEIISAPSSYS